MADRKKAKRLAKEHMKCNKPKRTPGHATKSHVVKACKDGEEKIIRFGQQGVKGAGKNPKTAKEKASEAQAIFNKHLGRGAFVFGTLLAIAKKFADSVNMDSKPPLSPDFCILRSIAEH